jgi:hypothetical protein
MVSRRSTLALFGNTVTVGLAGCLAGDDGPESPATVANRPVDAIGSVPQYQVDAATQAGDVYALD